MKYKITTLSWLGGLLILFPTGGFAQSLPDFIGVIKNEKSKVVHISATSEAKNRPTNDPFFRIFPNAPRERTERALGSGFFYSEDGYIVTNNHVIENADEIEVLLDDTRSFSARLIGADERTDLALLKIDADIKFPAMEWGNSDEVEVGQWVIAIGNPLGLDQTVTVGIISAKQRDILGGTAYGQFLQTDAAINFGNSGGPLINQEGEVIGISTAVAGNGQGIGFAIPSNLALNIIEQLENSGEVTRGWLGVGLQELTAELAESLNLENGQRGVLVSQVFPDTPAEKAGLEAQDLIVAVDNKVINTSSDLRQNIAETTPGKTVRIGILRNGKRLTKKATIAKFDEDNLPRASRPSTTNSNRGLELIDVNAEVKREYQLTVDSGVLVTAMAADSQFQGSLRVGDVVMKINNVRITSTKEFAAEIDKIKPKAAFAMLVNRQGLQIVVPARLE